MRLGQLQQTVDGFHGAISQLGFHVGSDAVAMALEGSRQIKEGRQARALGPSQSSLESCPLAVGQNILQKLPRVQRASQGQISRHEWGAALLVLAVARPRIASRGPESVAQIGTLSSDHVGHLTPATRERKKIDSAARIPNAATLSPPCYAPRKAIRSAGGQT